MAASGTTASTTARDRTRSALPWGFVLVLVLVSLSMRAPFVSVAPIADRLRDTLGVSGAAIGVLTSLPVLCFAVFAPAALAVIRRGGAERALSTCLALVVAGAAVRTLGGYPVVVVGTVLIGLGITVGNVVVPVLIRKETPPAYAGAMTGAYVSAMNVGSMAATLATVPLDDLAGWRVALLAWGLLALVGLLGWWAFLRGRRRADPDPAPRPAGSASPTRSTWRRPIAWLLALAFACQATSYYSLTAWLPNLLSDELGLGPGRAGVASSVFQVAAIIGALGIPVLSLRLPRWATIGLVGLLWISLPVLLLATPEHYLLGSVLGGIAQGGGFASLFTVVVHVSSTDRESARLSAFVQGIGYAAAATGPTVLGLVHDATGAWTGPMLIVVATTVGFTVLGVAAGVSARRNAV